MILTIDFEEEIELLREIDSSFFVSFVAIEDRLAAEDLEEVSSRYVLAEATSSSRSSSFWIFDLRKIISFALSSISDFHSGPISVRESLSMSQR